MLRKEFESKIFAWLALCFRKVTLAGMQSNARLGRETSQEIGPITQVGNDGDLKSIIEWGNERRWWVKRNPGAAGIISIWLVVYLENMEKGQNQALSSVNVDTIHQERKSKRWNSLGGSWLVLFWMQWNGSCHRTYMWKCLVGCSCTNGLTRGGGRRREGRREVVWERSIDLG